MDCLTAARRRVADSLTAVGSVGRHAEESARRFEPFRSHAKQTVMGREP